jgi:hypothetical protein
MVLPLQRLEAYSLRYPQEILQVWAQRASGEDCLLVFKGFSSSLTQGTAPDPDLPLLTAEEPILSLDRLQAPYQPQTPQYLEQGIPWEVMAQRLEAQGL